MPEFKLTFEYLCAFVPPAPFDNSPSHCWVVLPDLANASPKHVPVLLYDRDDRANLGEDNVIPKELGIKSPKSQDSREKLPFSHEEIEIRPDGKKTSSDELKIDSSLNSLLRISRAEVDLEVFNERFISGDISDVAGRLHLREGTLAVGQETPDIFGVYDASASPLKLLHKQKIAQRIVLSVGFNDYIDLIFRGIDKKDRYLRLRPATGSDVKMTLRNCEKERTWDEDLPPYKDQFDSEMNLFFPLSKDFDPGNLPHRIVLRPYQDTPNGICAPKAFDTWG